MKLEFHGSSQPTLGVELELQVLDPNTLDLTAQSENLLNMCEKIGLERVKAEVHQSMLEIDTEIAQDVKKCKQLLTSRITQLNDVADIAGVRLAAGGTHPFQNWTDRLISNVDRYHGLYQKFQWLVRRMNVYGLHVHVGVPSGEQALAVMRAMNPYLPLLLALSANSPFWHGTDTGMLSSRLNIMESFPFAGLPQHISSWKEFEHYYSALQASSGIVQSLKDLYWHIRPNLSYGTVEVRICDIMPTITETMAVVALIHCLVVSICENSQNNPKRLQLPPELDWIAPGNLWIAARDGLDGIIATDLNGTRQKISDILIELVEQLLPTAKKLHCEEELQDVLRIITNGNGAQRQLKTYFETKSLKQVVAVAMQEFTDSFATVV